MPRPETPINPDDGPVARFALELRALRNAAGKPSYRRLADRVHFSWSCLSQAAAGKAFPTWEVTQAFVEGCGGNVDEWRRKWRETRAALREDELASPGTDDGRGGVESSQVSDRFTSPRHSPGTRSRPTLPGQSPGTPGSGPGTGVVVILAVIVMLVVALVGFLSVGGSDAGLSMASDFRIGSTTGARSVEPAEPQRIVRGEPVPTAAGELPTGSAGPVSPRGGGAVTVIALHQVELYSQPIQDESHRTPYVIPRGARYSIVCYYRGFDSAVGPPVWYRVGDHLWAPDYMSPPEWSVPVCTTGN